jgi:SecD/SecF fusion protein
MRILRLVGIWCVTAMLWAGPWNVPQAGAQSPSKQKWCLSFHEVHPSLTGAAARQKGVPAGYRIYPGPGVGEELLLREVPVLHGGDMVDAQSSVDERSELVMTFRLSEAGASKFATFTRDNVERPFAIVVDGRVVAAPIINEPILGGEGQIMGPSLDELAARIRSGTCGGV